MFTFQTETQYNMTELDYYLPYVTEDNNKEINSSGTRHTTNL
jgi:hypothetical protein